ncbi:MAG: hypothetical protein J1E40_10620 [Oscillospiraceae bacterium]|nr:hypothetical protein [Oscillospiraceae bacterium]
MAVFKCKMCEANLEITGNPGVIKCEYCGTYQTVPGAELPDGTRTIQQVIIESGANVENLIKRGNLSIEDRKWNDAENFFDRVLDVNVEEPRAYIGKLLAENRVLTLEELWQSRSWNSVKSMDNYKKAYRFADDNMKQMLDEYYSKWIYREACKKARSYNTDDLEEAVRLFTSIIDYEDSRERAEKAQEAANEAIYNFASLRERSGNMSDLYLAIKKFESISDYKDSRERAEALRVRYFDLKEEAERAERRKKLQKQEWQEGMRQRAINREKIIKLCVIAVIAAVMIIYFCFKYFYII